MSISIEVDEVRFPQYISLGAAGGPSFKTDVIAAATGIEQRIGQWSLARHKWDVSHAMRMPSSMQVLIAFFIARQGKLRGFRFYDPRDHTATDELLYPTGGNSVQLYRTYTSGPRSYKRPIYKPVEAVGVTVTRGGVPFTDYTMDWNSGNLFPTADASKVISGITKAASGVVSATSHGYLVNDWVYISGVNGMTQINGRSVKITAVTTHTFTVQLDTSAYGTYTSGGTAEKFIQPSEVVRWTGEFDIPVRFDTDQMNLLQADGLARAWENIPIIELRGCPVIVEQSPPVIGGDAVLRLAYKFEDSAITTNSGSTGATHNLSQADLCEA